MVIKSRCLCNREGRPMEVISLHEPWQRVINPPRVSERKPNHGVNTTCVDLYLVGSPDVWCYCVCIDLVRLYKIIFMKHCIVETTLATIASRWQGPVYCHSAACGKGGTGHLSAILARSFVVSGANTVEVLRSRIKPGMLCACRRGRKARHESPGSA